MKSYYIMQSNTAKYNLELEQTLIQYVCLILYLMEVQFRGGWGMLNDTYKEFEVSGLMGSITDGGYAFSRIYLLHIYHRENRKIRYEICI